MLKMQLGLGAEQLSLTHRLQQLPPLPRLPTSSSLCSDYTPV